MNLLPDGATSVQNFYTRLRATQVTFQRWCKEHGGMGPYIVKRKIELERENTRLRIIVGVRRTYLQA